MTGLALTIAITIAITIAMTIAITIAITVAISYTGKNENLENFHQVKIEEGDSLWSIAEKFHENTQISKQEFVKWVQKLHSMPLQEWQAHQGDVLYRYYDILDFFASLFVQQ